MTKQIRNPNEEGRGARPLVAHRDFGIRLLGFIRPLSFVLGYYSLLFVWNSQSEAASNSTVVFEQTSPYHHIRVVDEAGTRTLYFDNAPESRMSVANKLAGHFEYTEYFHMPWLWNTQIASVVMIGLGGGSTQRSFAHYYPNVSFRTVEIDPAVVRVARDFFDLKENEKQKVEVSDGRLFLKRSTEHYDLIILDAYLSGRYGSSIPQHLATKEFFELARDRLTTNGAVAYNVIGTVSGWHSDLIGAMYRTLKTVFPQVYVFPARTSMNIVFVATRSNAAADLPGVRWRAAQMVQSRQITLPRFQERGESFLAVPPASASRSPILTDDYAPVEGLAAAQ
jgi:spermidine synthase